MLLDIEAEHVGTCSLLNNIDNNSSRTCHEIFPCPHLPMVIDGQMLSLTLITILTVSPAPSLCCVLQFDNPEPSPVCDGEFNAGPDTCLERIIRAPCRSRGGIIHRASDIRAVASSGESGVAHVITLVWAVSIWPALSEHSALLHCYIVTDIVK